MRLLVVERLAFANGDAGRGLRVSVEFPVLG
jgi:hypothetical protein